MCKQIYLSIIAILTHPLHKLYIVITQSYENLIWTAWADPAGSKPPGMAKTPPGKKKEIKFSKNTHKNNLSLLVETSLWLEPVTFVKQIQTANIC